MWYLKLPSDMVLSPGPRTEWCSCYLPDWILTSDLVRPSVLLREVILTIYAKVKLTYR